MGFCISVCDIIDCKQIEVELCILVVVFDLCEGMFIIDVNSKILCVNKVFMEIIGYIVEEIVGKYFNLLCLDCYGLVFFQEMCESVWCFGKWQGEIWDCCKNGEVYFEWLIIFVVKNKDNQVIYYVSMYYDISDCKLVEECICELVFFDVLICLFNCILLLDCFKQVIVLLLCICICGVLLFIDLDYFKILNDMVGYEKGDILLKQVVQCLLVNVCENDMVVCVGGDEFVVVLEGFNDIQQEVVIQICIIGEKILVVLG